MSHARHPPLQDLYDAVLNPTGKGDSIALNLTPDGGLMITPLVEDEADGSRALVLEPEQTEYLRLIIGMDPERASKLVARHIQQQVAERLDRGTMIGTRIGYGTALILGMALGTFLTLW